MDEKYMKLAIKMGEKAATKDEVPIGAVIVCGDEVICKAHNMKEKKNSSLYHAEIVALTKAAAKLGRWRLSDCTLYVTLEPCAMCAGACLNYRIGRVVFGAYDKRMGVLGTVLDLSNNPNFNHNFEVTGGILEKECAKLLSDFFEKKRSDKKKKLEK